MTDFIFNIAMVFVNLFQEFIPGPQIRQTAVDRVLTQLPAFYFKRCVRQTIEFRSYGVMEVSVEEEEGRGGGRRRRSLSGDGNGLFGPHCSVRFTSQISLNKKDAGSGRGYTPFVKMAEKGARNKRWTGEVFGLA
jgi:hypothetical protein